MIELQLSRATSMLTVVCEGDRGRASVAQARDEATRWISLSSTNVRPSMCKKETYITTLILVINSGFAQFSVMGQTSQYYDSKFQSGTSDTMGGCGDMRT